METNVNYALVGFFVIVFTTVAIVIALWLAVGEAPVTYDTYLVYMDESVAGLNKRAPVKYNGVDVGYIDDIRLNLKNPQEVILFVKIDSTIPLLDSTRAVLNQQGITGVTYLGLRSGRGGKPLVTKPGFPYPVILSAPSFLVRLDTTIQTLATNIDVLADSVKDMFNAGNRKKFTEILEHINEVTGNLAANSSQINESIQSLNTLLNKGVQGSKKLSVITPQFYDTLQSIQQTSDSLQNMTSDMSQNPAAMLLGKKPPPKGPGE